MNFISLAYGEICLQRYNAQDNEHRFYSNYSIKALHLKDCNKKEAMTSYLYEIFGIDNAYVLHIMPRLLMNQCTFVGISIHHT